MSLLPGNTKDLALKLGGPRRAPAKRFDRSLHSRSQTILLFCRAASTGALIVKPGGDGTHSLSSTRRKGTFTKGTESGGPSVCSISKIQRVGIKAKPATCVLKLVDRSSGEPIESGQVQSSTAPVSVCLVVRTPSGGSGSSFAHSAHRSYAGAMLPAGYC